MFEAIGGDAGEDVSGSAKELYLIPICLRTWLQNYEIDQLRYIRHYDGSFDPAKVATPLHDAALI